ncbi:MAG: CopD family protein [Ilumatobacter fluminis]|uniref:copper resistance CopC/CopD family protein n=1 Tax=Ilumatobacter fluminis TaxID=467091 RepID=UPI0032ED9D41
MTAATTRYRRARIAVALLIGALFAVGTGQLASAHTDFESSSPTDGGVVDGPLTEVVVNFTNAARPAGDGFQLLDPTGTVISPSAIDETDGTSFVLTFDPPLEAGTYGVRWSVQAGDAHPIDGSFRFEVTGAPPTTETAAEAAPPAASGAAPSTTTATAAADDMDMDAADHAAMSDDTLDAFLEGGSTGDDSVVVGRTGRILSIVGLIFGLGVLAALVWTTRGHRDELLTHLNWVRLAGLVMFTGGLIEYAALTENDPNTSFGSILSTKPALATALKMAGGLAVMLGFHERAGRIVAPARSLSAAVATAVAPPTDVSSATPRRYDDGANEHRWTPTSTAAVGLLGYALVLISFWFDGHTVSKGPWAIHSLVNLVHLGAAAVWGGGVFAMTTVAWMRRRRSERIGLAAMVVRFSSIATVSLAAVIVAGLVMTWMVLDSPGDLFGTSWGRVLVAKTAVVAVAAGLGGYNHFRLRPALEQRPDDPHLARELRVSLSIESAVFVVVVVLTAILVASAT